MKLLDNWWTVLKKAWSVRLMALAAILQLLQTLVPYVDEFLPRWLTVAILVAAFISRFVSQDIPESNDAQQA
jgi:hypothetical protein